MPGKKCSFPREALTVSQDWAGLCKKMSSLVTGDSLAKAAHLAVAHAKGRAGFCRMVPDVVERVVTNLWLGVSGHDFSNLVACGK